MVSFYYNALKKITIKDIITSSNEFWLCLPPEFDIRFTARNSPESV